MKLPSTIVLAVFLGRLNLSEAVKLQETNQEKMIERTQLLELQQLGFNADNYDSFDSADYA